MLFNLSIIYLFTNQKTLSQYPSFQMVELQMREAVASTTVPSKLIHHNLCVCHNTVMTPSAMSTEICRLSPAKFAIWMPAQKCCSSAT